MNPCYIGATIHKDTRAKFMHICRTEYRYAVEYSPVTVDLRRFNMLHRRVGSGHVPFLELAEMICMLAAEKGERGSKAYIEEHHHLWRIFQQSRTGIRNDINDPPVIH
jgi:hypothetical protein